MILNTLMYLFKHTTNEDSFRCQDEYKKMLENKLRQQRMPKWQERSITNNNTLQVNQNQIL